MNDELRHNVGIDCTSLLETDGIVDFDEDAVLAIQSLIGIIKQLPTDRDKFIAVCLAFDIQKKDVASMLDKDQSWMSHEIARLRVIMQAMI